MRIITLIIAQLLLLNVAFSQDYMDEIAEKACDCLSNISSEMNSDEMNMELGLCIIAAANPHAKKLKKDHGIDMDNIDEQGEELGALIGVQMATVCPMLLVEIATQMDEGVEGDLADMIEGEVVAISDEQFVEFSIKDDYGQTSKVYWLWAAETDFDLTDSYKTLKNKNVRVYYFPEEFFDPKTGEYALFNVIASIELVED